MVLYMTSSVMCPCLQDTNTTLLGNCYSDHPWPAMPKHMRTITEDSLEYRLDSSQGNNSRPSSRGGLLGSTTGHNRASSAGTTDMSVASPLSNHSRTPTSALSASLAAAAGDGTSLAFRHSHSHSNSGGSGTTGAVLSASNTMMSPLSRSSSAQPNAVDSTLYAQEPAALSVRVSLDSLGPCSVRTRITHNSSSSRSSPDDDSSFSVGNGSRQSSPDLEGATSSRSSTPRSTYTLNGGTNTATARDISFGGMANSQQLQTAQQGLHAPGLSLLGVETEQVHLSGLSHTEPPAAASHGAAAAHAHHSSVDFSAMHLADLSRPVVGTPSPEGCDGCPDHDDGSQHATVSSEEARWSPFARSGHLATSIAAAGVGHADSFWRLGVQRVEGVQSQPAQGVQGSVQQQDMQRRSDGKQRFIRPEPGWRPPAEAATELSPQGTSTDSHPPQSQSQPQPNSKQRDAVSVQGTPDVAPEHASMQASRQQPSSHNGLQRPAATSTIAANKETVNSSAVPVTHASTGLQGLHARAQRQRVMPRNICTGPSACNSSEPSPGQTVGGWAPSGHQQGSKGSQSAATSHSGHSRVTSPFAASTFITPRDAVAVAGAAVGAGQELVAPQMHNTLLSPMGPGMLIDPLDQLNTAASVSDADIEVVNSAYRRDCVAYDWWKELDATAFGKYDANGQQGEQVQHDRSLFCVWHSRTLCGLAKLDEGIRELDNNTDSTELQRWLSLHPSLTSI